ncbi:MAG: PucR family transcriptional regulator, partial [Thermoleophilaceae bacterium]|nr:PucR family transcriptional regulator [Thermoleophilaceae bacterium]
MTTEPWEALPREVATSLRPELPALADEIVGAVRDEVPAYGQGDLPPRLRVGVEEALRQFLEMIERPGGRRRPARDVYVGLGRGEMRAGRGLDALLAAYRVG